jgi:hypothetical protein
MHMGTMGRSAYQPRKDGSGKSDVLFNGPGDGSEHRHVVQSVNANGNPIYHSVHDAEGHVYVDEKQRA